MRRTLLISIMCGVAVANCAGTSLQSAAPVGSSVIRACGAAQLNPFRVVIEPTAVHPVSGVYLSSGTQFAIDWAPGFRVQTIPELAVLDPSGKVVARNGEVISDAGGSPGDPAFICIIGGTIYPA
jgi:hypothetical protein